MSTNLTRRLDALEEIAERARRRELEEIVRVLARECGVDTERVLELDDQGRARTAELRAHGLTDEQIAEAIARDRGLTVAELRARSDALLERLGVTDLAK